MSKLNFLALLSSLVAASICCLVLLAPSVAHAESAADTVAARSPLVRLLLGQANDSVDAAAAEHRRKRGQAEPVQDNSQQQQANVRPHQQKEQQQEYIIKRRLQKLLDQMMDEESDQRLAVKRNTESSYKRNQMRKRIDEDDYDSNEKIMIIVKKPRKKLGHKTGLLNKSLLLEQLEAANANSELQDDTLDSNESPLEPVEAGRGSNGRRDPGQWDILGQRSRDMHSAGARQPNLSDHARRIMEDGFGIMKESTFSTNNHLGLKNVPKFGSDEEY